MKPNMKIIELFSLKGDIVRFLAILIVMPIFLSAGTPLESSEVETYDIVAVYEKVDVKDGAKALDSYGNLREVKTVYEPIRMTTGRYEVELTKIDSNFYHICGTSMYIETKYCYEYAVREDVIINITSSYGYTIGEVIFFD